VRSSTETADRVLRRALAPYLVDDVEARSGYYSVILGPTVPSRAGERPLSMLYADGVAVARSRSARRVVRALAAYLAGHNTPTPPGGILRFDAVVAAVGDRGALLLPKGALGHFDLCRFERELVRLGLRLVDSPHVDIDPETAELIVGSPPLALDESALDELGPSGAEDAVPPGRYPLAMWAVAQPDEETGLPTRAEAVAHGLTLVTPRSPEEGQATAEAVLALAGRCTLVGFDASSMPATLAGISATLQAARIGQAAAAMRSTAATASPRSPLTSR